MKKKLSREKAYQKLLHTLFLQTLFSFGGAALLVILLRELLRGKIGNAILKLITVAGHMSDKNASLIYQYTVRNNMSLIIDVGIILAFLLLFRLTITWFTRYFDQMIDGIDKLADESNEVITMSPELDFMAVKLNEVRDKLQKRAEEVQIAEQRKNDLVVYLAHDIKTPLTSVIGYLSLLDEAPDMSPQQKEKYIHIALDKAYRLEKLINEFFEITRYNLRDIPLHKEKFSLRYMLMQVTDELYPQLSSHGNEAILYIPEDILLYGDSEKLARVFNNLLKNAVAYGTRNSPIHIYAQEKETLVAILIENEGEIPQDKLDCIFEKFFRLDEARSSSTGGSGLGLAISKDIITLHGGSITAHSSGGRTTFTIELPGQAVVDSLPPS